MNTRFLMTLCCCLLPFTLKGAGKEDMKWFTDAKFGMFIHWGLYSQTAGDWKGHPTKGGEHFMLYERIPVKEYALIANDFNPTEFNARKWVKTAKEAGMKYIVITSKHHDGFAMYHSACSDYNIVTRTPFARDPMKELADECRKQGLKFGFYYSLGRDWEDPDVPTNWPTKAGRSNTWDFRFSRFFVGIIFYLREVLLTLHYEKRLFEHASQPRVAGSDIRLLSHLWSRTNLSRDSYQSG